MTRLAIFSLKTIALLSLGGSWFQLRSRSIFTNKSDKLSNGHSKFFFSPAHGPLILFMCIILLDLTNLIKKIYNSKEEKRLFVKYTELVDYWSALNPKKHRPMMIGNEFYYKG